GKVVGVPFGAAAERVVHEGLAEAGLKASEVKFRNLGMLEHGPLIRRGGEERWGQYDALSGFDPIPAILEAKGEVRKVHDGKVCALIVMREPEKRAAAARALVKAFAE